MQHWTPVAVDEKAASEQPVERFREATIMKDDLATQPSESLRREEIAFRARRLWEQRGCPSREQAASDELVRARNKAVRDHHHTPEAAVVPPFASPSGSL
jgi:hypothetical protein